MIFVIAPLMVRAGTALCSMVRHIGAFVCPVIIEMFAGALETMRPTTLALSHIV